MFLAGQVSWFALTLIPALMAMTENCAGPFRAVVRATLRNRTAIGILIGGLLSFVVFLLQVALYESDLPLLISHLRLQTATEQGQTMSKLHLFGLVAVRAVAFVGVPLLLGAVVVPIYTTLTPEQTETCSTVSQPSIDGRR